MTRTHLAILMALVLAVPAAAAGGAALLTLSAKPCFMAGSTAYQFSGSAVADYTVRVDSDPSPADLHMRLVNDPSLADFVLVDDEDAEACRTADATRSIRVDNAAAQPDMTVTLSKQPNAGDFKVYLRSANFSGDDAAALVAVMWKISRGREFLARR